MQAESIPTTKIVDNAKQEDSNESKIFSSSSNENIKRVKQKAPSPSPKVPSPVPMEVDNSLESKSINEGLKQEDINLDNVKFVSKNNFMC